MNEQCPKCGSRKTTYQEQESFECGSFFVFKSPDSQLVESVACSSLASKDALIKELREAAQTLVNQLKTVHASDAYFQVWHCHFNHFGQYNGPTYTDEMNALSKLLEAKPN